MAGPTVDSSRFVASLGVRPARAVVLVPKVKGWSWLALFEGALAAQSRCWGGSANLVLPFSVDLKDRDLFWELADRFDADTFVTYEPTYADTQEILPAWHKSFMAKQRAEFTKEHGAEVADQFIAELASHRPIEGRLDPAWLEPIRRRLAPLHHLPEKWVLRTMSGLGAPPGPIMDATAFTELPGEVWNPTTTLGLTARLLLTATVGRLSGGTRKALVERDVSILDEKFDRQLSWAGIVTDSRRPSAYKPPWGVSDSGLSFYRRGADALGVSALVVGDTAWDFALFYALRRMTGQAWWLPSWLRTRTAYMWELRHALEYGPAELGRTLAIVSASSPAARDRAADLRSTSGKPLAAEVANWRDVLPNAPLRPFETDNQGRAQFLELVSGRTLPLPTPIPKRVATMPETSMRWITDLEGAEWTPIRHPALGAKLLDTGLYDSGNVRTSRDGVAYTGPNVIILAGEGLESAVVRPTLRPAPLLDQLQDILEPQGWRVEASDKGIYAAESAKLFGGVRELAAALRNRATRAVLDAYLDKTQPGQSLSDGRRYLSFQNFTDIIDDDSVTSTLPSLLGSMVVERGLILRCQRCRQKAWYDLARIAASFTCDRCRLVQDVERGWGSGDEPPWFYRLAEVLYQFLKSNGDLPVLAVHDKFGEQLRVDQSYELDLVSPENGKLEMDIFVSDGPRLWIGEATTSGGFDSGRLAKVAEVAGLLDAYGVLLATSKTQWSPGTKAEAAAVFRDQQWPRLEMVTKVK